MRGRNFLKRKLSPPHPLFKELNGRYIKNYIVRSEVVRWCAEEFLWSLFEKSSAKTFILKSF